MADYALLLLPATNRVYAEASGALALAELGVFDERLLGGRLRDLAEVRIGGVRYLTFTAPPLEPREVRLLAFLSTAYALFERVDGLLRPIELQAPARFDDDLLSIQKYQGKTNEHFTRLLLNVAAASTAFAGELLDRKLHVFDPLCGRGTTLQQALMYGWDASGMELDERDVALYEQFVGTYLKRKRLKHALRGAAIREGKKTVGRRFTFELGATREAYKAGETLHLTVVGADTRQAREHFGSVRFDVIATDLPYGVQHGSSSDQGLSRRPLELLEAALPGWVALLRPGGALGLAWNRHVAGRERVAELLAAQGLEVSASAPYQSFRHVVDHAITRDVLVARKPA
jgi:hypothetical protein